jgi:hypothetical protein
MGRSGDRDDLDLEFDRRRPKRRRPADRDFRRRRPPSSSAAVWVVVLIAVGGPILVVVGIFVLCYSLLFPPKNNTQPQPVVAFGPQDNFGPWGNPVPLPQNNPPAGPQLPPGFPQNFQPPGFPGAPPDIKEEKKPDPPKPPDPQPQPKPKVGEEAAVIWGVQPDPLPQKIEGPFNLNGSLRCDTGNHVIYPSRPSPFVAVSLPDSDPRDRMRVWDLRQMKPVGVIMQHTLPCSRFSLSPDGSYLALRPDRSVKPTVEVLSSGTGDRVRTIAVDQNEALKVGWIDFAGKDRLITMKHEGEFPNPAQKATYQVWDIRTGRELVQFSYELVFHPRCGALSPGGRYLALEKTHEGYHLLFWDLLTGKLAGRLAFQGKEEPWGQPGGIAFARDGREVALLWRLNDQDTWGRLFCFDTSTGRKILDKKIGQEHFALDYHWNQGGQRSFQWLPDGKGWLLADRLIFDRDGAFVGDVAPEMKESREVRDRRFLDREHFSLTVPAGAGQQIRIARIPDGKPPALPVEAERDEKK